MIVALIISLAVVLLVASSAAMELWYSDDGW